MVTEGEGATQQRIKRIRDQIAGRKQEHKRLKQQLRAADNRTDRRELRKKRESAKQGISRMEDELRAVKHRRAQERLAGEPDMGALPDFAIIGQRRSGTTFLYHLLTLHPLVQPPVTKEPHFFGVYFEEGVEWYRRFFPRPKMKDGRTTITGEATPSMANPHAPERMAQIVPRARLIALLREPVDRAYSDYQHMVGRDRESRSFEEAIGLDENSLDDTCGHISRSLYVDQLLRWHKFFAAEQMLVLKSEELYERPSETLKVVLNFLGLPEWEPEASEVTPKKQNKGGYEREGMDPATRRKLEEYFAPHNERLYEYLGRDFGW